MQCCIQAVLRADISIISMEVWLRDLVGWLNVSEVTTLDLFFYICHSRFVFSLQILSTIFVFLNCRSFLYLASI